MSESWEDQAAITELPDDQVMGRPCYRKTLIKGDQDKDRLKTLLREGQVAGRQSYGRTKI